MSQDLRLYSLSLLIVLMLWNTSAHATYGSGSGCPVVAVPALDNANGMWSPEGDFSLSDLRNLYPLSDTTFANVDYGHMDTENCVVVLGTGTYYDGANHLWTLDENLECFQNTGYFQTVGVPDFRDGTDY